MQVSFLPLCFHTSCTFQPVLNCKSCTSLSYSVNHSLSFAATSWSSTTLLGNRFLLLAIVGDNKVWFHHANELVYSHLGIPAIVGQVFKGSKHASKCVNMNSADVDSIGEVTAPTRTTKQSILSLQPQRSRAVKCMGDFCSYINDFSEVHGEFELNLDGDSANIKHETRQAIKRHRSKTAKGATRETNGAESGSYNSDESYTDNSDNETIEADGDEPILNGYNDDVRKDHFVDPLVADGFSSVRLGSSRGATAGNSTLQPIAMASTKNLKVAMKSIVLARKEMDEIDLIEGRNNHTTGTDESFVSTHESNIWPSKLRKWYIRIGRSHVKSKSNSLALPVSSAHRIALNVLGSKAIEAGTGTDGGDGTSSSHKTKKIDFNKMKELTPRTVERSSMARLANETNPNHFGEHESNSVGQLSWYYSSHRVCDRCYKVYNELDRRRKLRHKHMLKLQKELLDSEDSNKDKWRDVERRIFQQRQFVTRLMKEKEKKAMNGNKLRTSFSTGSILTESSSPNKFSDPFEELLAMQREAAQLPALSGKKTKSSKFSILLLYQRRRFH